MNTSWKSLYLSPARTGMSTITLQNSSSSLVKLNNSSPVMAPPKRSYLSTLITALLTDTLGR